MSSDIKRRELITKNYEKTIDKEKVAKRLNSIAKEQLEKNLAQKFFEYNGNRRNV